MTGSVDRAREMLPNILKSLNHISLMPTAQRDFRLDALVVQVTLLSKVVYDLVKNADGVPKDGT